MKNEKVEVGRFDMNMPVREFKCISKDKLPYSITTEDGEKVFTFKLSDITA